MSDPASASARPTEPQKPKLLPIVLTIAGGALLALISCGGFLGSMENAALNAFFVAFFVGFFLGVILFIGGLVAAAKRKWG